MLKFLLAALLAFSLLSPAQARVIEPIADGTEFSIFRIIEDDGTTSLAYQGNMTYTGIVMLSVELRAGTYDRLEMHSPGGLAVSGYILAATLEETGTPMVVRAGHACMSSCAYAALRAPELIIEGLLGFHLPYVDLYEVDMTPLDYAAISNGVTLQFTWFALNAGYNFQFVSLMALETTPESFMVFTDEDSLYQFRTKPLTVVEETDILYEILTEDEVILYMQ